MTKKEVGENIVSRIQLVIDDIKKQCKAEVSALEDVKQAEVDKAVFTFEEIRTLYDKLRDSHMMQMRSSSEFSGYSLFDEIQRVAKTKV